MKKIILSFLLILPLSCSDSEPHGNPNKLIGSWSLDEVYYYRLTGEIGGDTVKMIIDNKRIGMSVQHLVFQEDSVKATYHDPNYIYSKIRDYKIEYKLIDTKTLFLLFFPALIDYGDGEEKLKYTIENNVLLIFGRNERIDNRGYRVNIYRRYVRD